MSIVSLSPQVPTFGFKVELEDKADEESPNKMKCDYVRQSLAPGMQSVVKIMLYAQDCHDVNYELYITRGSDEVMEVFTISAVIVPSNNFKKITRNLKMRKKDIYSPGVTCLGVVSLTQSSYIGDGAPSMYTEVLIPDEDFEDLQHIPFVKNVYYNPYNKAFVQDEELSRVCTNNKWSAEDSKKETLEKWDKRLLELEAKGMVTERVFEQMSKERSVFSVHSFTEDS